MYISTVPVCLCTPMDESNFTSAVAEGLNIPKQLIANTPTRPRSGDWQSIIVSLAALAVSIVAVIDPKLFA